MSIALAKEHIKSAEWKEALDILQQLDNKGEASAESQYLLGTIFYRMDQLGPAEEAFRRSLLLDPDFTDAALSLSIIYNDTGNYQEAENAFVKAQSIANKKGKQSSSNLLLKEIAEKHHELGKLYFKANRPDCAANEFLKAINQFPDLIEAHVDLAKAHAQRGQTKEAERVLQRAIEKIPEYVDAHLNLALLHYSRGNTLDAQVVLTNALQLHPSNSKIRKYLKLVQKAATDTTIPLDDSRTGLAN